MEKELGGKAGVQLCKLEESCWARSRPVRMRLRKALGIVGLGARSRPAPVRAPLLQVRWPCSATAEAGTSTPAWLRSGQSSSCGHPR